MRSFGGSRGPSEFELGFFWGFVSFIGIAVAFRAFEHVAQWESVSKAREPIETPSRLRCYRWAI